MAIDEFLPWRGVLLKSKLLNCRNRSFILFYLPLYAQSNKYLLLVAAGNGKCSKMPISTGLKTWINVHPDFVCHLEPHLQLGDEEIK